jgi:hypothetical protein
MRAKWTIAALALGLSVALLALVAMPQAQEPSPSPLVSRKTATPPTLDGTVDDAWNAVTPLTVRVSGGRNLPGGSTEVRLRAMHTADTVYFLMEYQDPTQSFERSPWEKQADGSWKLLKDPNDKGGDNNLLYEDKVAVIWNINSPTFETRGCFSACHIGEGKPYGNKYTAKPGERLDMWHWKSVRTGPVDQIDDQYVDSTRYDAEKAKEAGRKADPKTAGGYVDNQTPDRSRPMWALPENRPAPPYWILDGEKTSFDDAKYKAGDRVPSIVIAPFTGDRSDLTVKSTWKDGTWTLEFSRKLTTGSEYDVQFDDLKKEYAFGVAVFNNAQVRHAFSPGVLKLAFER